MSGSDHDDDSAGMLVQRRFLMRAVVDGENLYALVLKIQLVMHGRDLGGILAERTSAQAEL